MYENFQKIFWNIYTGGLLKSVNFFLIRIVYFIFIILFMCMQLVYTNISKNKSILKTLKFIVSFLPAEKGFEDFLMI